MAFSSGAAPVLADAMIYAVPTKNLIASDSLIFHRGRNDKERLERSIRFSEATVHTDNPVGLARELDVANTCQKTAPSSVHKESQSYQPTSIFPDRVGVHVPRP